MKGIRSTMKSYVLGAAVLAAGLVGADAYAQQAEKPGKAQHRGERKFDKKDHAARQAEHLSKLKEKLSLNEQQVAQIKQILEEQKVAREQQHANMKANKPAGELTDAQKDALRQQREQMRAQMQAQHEVTKSRILAVLNAEQKAKFQEMSAKMQERFQNKGERGGHRGKKG